MRLDHIGIAVTSLEEGARLYATGLGLPEIAREEVLGEKVRVVKLDTGNTHIELLEPLDGEGPIAKHLEKRGPGIHHICFSVPDVRAAMTAVKALGMRTLSDEPKAGAGGCQVVFLHPKDGMGTLIELSQPPADATH